MCKSIEGVNGAVGKTLDWIRWISEVAVIPVLILGLLWFVRLEDKFDVHEKENLHVEVEIWKSIATKADTDDLPTPEVTRAISRLEATLLRIEGKIDQHINNQNAH